MATDRNVIKHHSQVMTNPEVWVIYLVSKYTKLQYIHNKIQHTKGLKIQIIMSTYVDIATYIYVSDLKQ